MTTTPPPPPPPPPALTPYLPNSRSNSLKGNFWMSTPLPRPPSPEKGECSPSPPSWPPCPPGGIQFTQFSGHLIEHTALDGILSSCPIYCTPPVPRCIHCTLCKYEMSVLEYIQNHTWLPPCSTASTPTIPIPTIVTALLAWAGE